MVNRTEGTGGARNARGSGNGHSRPSLSATSPGSDGTRGSIVSTRGEGRSIQRGTQLLTQLGIVELLEQDERPTFIVDLENDDDKSSSQLNLLFANPALRAQPAVLQGIAGKSDNLTLIFTTSTPCREFKSWVLSKHESAGASERSATLFVFAGFTWRSSTIRGCFRVVHVDTDSAIGIANEKNSGPNLQQLLGPGSSSPRSARDTRPEAASYFDTVMPQGDHLGTRSRMSVLYQDSSNDRSSESSRGQYSPQYSSSPTANGDVGISKILTSATDIASSETSHVAVFPVPLNGEESQKMNTEPPSQPGFFDWTRLPITPAMPQHIQFARSIDWGATSLGSVLWHSSFQPGPDLANLFLGPIEKWSSDLRGMCNLIMASPHPAAMYWGPEHVAIYNEAYIALAGKKHPELMGKRYADVWSEIWLAVADVFADALSSAQATMKDDDCKLSIIVFPRNPTPIRLRS